VNRWWLPPGWQWLALILAATSINLTDWPFWPGTFLAAVAVGAVIEAVWQIENPEEDE